MSAFHGAYVGVNLTDDADRLFGQHEPWTVSGGQRSDPNEGHCIVKVGADGHQLDTWVTWGALQQSTLAWTAACLDEAWVIITGKTPERPASTSPRCARTSTRCTAPAAADHRNSPQRKPSAAGPAPRLTSPGAGGRVRPAPSAGRTSGLERHSRPVEHAGPDDRHPQRQSLRRVGRVPAGEFPDPGQPVGHGPDGQVQAAGGLGGDPAGRVVLSQRGQQRPGPAPRPCQRREQGADQVRDGRPVTQDDLIDEQV